MAVDDAASTNEDADVTIDAAANDTDAEGGALSVEAVGTPDHGSASVVAGKVVYSPPANWAGEAKVTYTVSDGDMTDEGEITITVTAVNDAPVAVDDAASTNEDADVTIDAAANDTDVDSSGLAVSAVGTPDHGSASVVAGKVVYSPPANWAGEAKVTYTVSDGDMTDEGEITITVTAVNDAPVAVDDSASALEDANATGNLLTNDSDPEGDSLGAAKATDPANGAVLVNANGTFTYTPAANFNGSDSFTYTVSDGHGGTDTGSVTISVTAVNDVPSFVKGFDQTVSQDAPAQTLSWATAMFAGPDNEAGQAVNFIVTNNNNALFSAQPAVAPNGTLTYTPAPGAYGSATVSVKIHDDGGTANGGVDTSAIQTFMINVTYVAPTNDPPVITTITVPTTPYKVNTPISVSGVFTDANAGDTHTAKWTWDDGTTSAGTVNGVSRTVSGSHTYTTPGIYTISLNVKDQAGAATTRTATTYVAVYDPSAGFVIGAGWINSPAGAYRPDPTKTGTAVFGFLSKYVRGASRPSGITEFVYCAGGMWFSSCNYDWLVCVGNKAVYRGTGYLNGKSGYKFVLSAIEGGSKGKDKFRIRIWDESHGVVYDNLVGADDSMDDADPTTVIAGGAIVISK